MRFPSFLVCFSSLFCLSSLAQQLPTQEIVWAVNAGGMGFTSAAGVRYEADASHEGGRRIHARESIVATPDSILYQSARQGSVLNYQKELPNGRYHVTLKFAELQLTDMRQRVFEVYAEDILRLPIVDIVADREGKNLTAYDISIPNVNVEDGQLNLRFEGITNTAQINAFVVRKPHQKADNWQLVWQDEFDQPDGIDKHKWNFELWEPGRVNDELQRYTNRPENARLENGELVIEARRDHFEGDEYSSARLTSAGKGDILYGRIEVKAKLPDGIGTWPAIWMMPTNILMYADNCTATDGRQYPCHGWPNSGEIDIMEHVGYDEGRIHGTVHTKAYYWKIQNQHKGAVYVPDVTDAYHVYALEWTPERLDIFIDDVRYFTYLNKHEGWPAWPFDQPFHVILNIAVGGGWGGAMGVDKDIWPKQMRVDYVRMYQQH